MQVPTLTLRVLELGSAAATEFCGKLFAGFGSSVVRVRFCKRPVSADPPQVADEITPEYVWFNTGKETVVLDGDKLRDGRYLRHLIESADVILDGLGPAALEKLGVDVEALCTANPGLILVRVTPFGQSGPYRDFAAEEITLYAMSGLMYATGDGAREPLNAGPRICSIAAGQKAFTAALMAVMRRYRTGCGSVVDLSIHEASLDLFEIAIAEFFAQGKVARRNNDEHHGVPWRTYPCKDGHAVVIAGPPRRWPQAAAAVFGEPRLSKEFPDMASRINNRREVERLMMPWLMANDRLTIYHALQSHGLAGSYLASLTEALEDPQNKARSAFVEIDQPGLGRCTIPGAPFKATQLRWRSLRAPAPDVSTVDPERMWIRREAASAASRQSSDVHDLPLAGIRVLDFSHDWAGPHASRLLADYGADVIKVEYPRCIDSMRGGLPNKVNEHPRFWQLHRNKRAVTLDLKVPEHLECCRKLIASADIVIENSRAGVMDRLGVGYKEMSALNPRLIFISMSAFGATGPDATYAGFGATIEGISGLQWVTGYDEKACRMRIREMDVLSGVFGTCAALLALVQRESSGRGQWIDFSEREGAAWLIGDYFAACTAAFGALPVPCGNRHPRFVQGVYPTAGEDRWVVITLRDDREWQALAGLMGDESLLTDARFATMSARRKYHNLLDARISAWTSRHSSEEAMARLQALGVPAGAVCTVRDLAQDPHLQARQWFLRTLEGDTLPGYPFRISGTPLRAPRRGPKLGEHNGEILPAFGLPRERWPDLTPRMLKTVYHFDVTGLDLVPVSRPKRAASL
jgi:crotonobetainyl-CoA:carnitine CoA-transferase CaiB-like acyl-CoA transferase